jgi:hypothetical protein
MILPTNALADKPATDATLIRIAGALERIAGDIERLAVLAEADHLRTQRRLATLAQRLVDDAHGADEAFVVADTRLANGAKYPRERDVLTAWVRRSEGEAMAAWERLRAFEARHPEITLPSPSWSAEADA